jgi:glycyl-tRNA synthetase (class II)
VTIRDRDSMEQVRVPIAELGAVFRELLGGAPWSQVSARYPALAAKAFGS